MNVMNFKIVSVDKIEIKTEDGEVVGQIDLVEDTNNTKDLSEAERK